jgi:4a-hydroxytetrahydrobiopterin dehydratase
MTDLCDRTCVPCQRGAPPLTADQSRALAAQIDRWSVVDNHHIEKTWRFPDFATVMTFANAVAALADEQGHHPELLLAWGSARVRIWTLKIDGLTESDFVLAAKIDRLDQLPHA